MTNEIVQVGNDFEVIYDKINMSKIKQYAILTDNELYVRPFRSMKEAKEWCDSYLGGREGCYISVVNVVDIASRFTLKK